MKRRAEKIMAGTALIGDRDPVMQRLVCTCPPLTSLKLERNRFAALTNSILSQQISVPAARTIRGRLKELLGSDALTADNLRRLRVPQLRSIGISGIKASYLKDLAVSVSSGQLRLVQIGRASDEVVIRQLTEVRGIGVWTAQMFLIFSLGRLDVFPHEDHGVRSAIRRLYRLKELPSRNTSLELAAAWSPYRTIASWYLWRSHEMKGNASGGI